MKVIYRIYQFYCPSVLEYIKNDGYYQSMGHRYALEILDETGVEADHDSFELAIAEIEKHKDKLEGHDLTILPVIEVPYDYQRK